MNNNIASNPQKLRYYALCNEGVFYVSIIVAYFASKGVNLADFLTIIAYFNIALLIFEIPSGYISDRFGRRVTIIVASIIMFLSYLWLWQSSGFWDIVIAETFIAIGISFVSGTSSALMYDSLLAEERQGDFSKEEGRAKAWGAYSIGIAGLCGGFLYTIHTDLPIILTCIVGAFAIWLAFQLVEPAVHKAQANEHPIREMTRFIHYALRGHEETPSLILYSAILNGGSFLNFWLTQPYWEAAGFPYWMFGVLFLLMQLGRGWCHGNASKIIEYIGYSKLTLILWLVTVISFIFEGLFIHPYAVFITLIPGLVFGVANVMILEMINQRVESHMRATVISVDSMAWRLMFVIATPVAVYLIDNYNLATTFLVAGGVWFVLGIIPILILIKKRVIKVT